MKKINLAKLVVISTLSLVSLPLYADYNNTTVTTTPNTNATTTTTTTMPSTTMSVSDANITSQVQAKLQADSTLSGINATTTNGIVYLSGMADNQAEIDNATKLAQAVTGVQKVDNTGITLPATQ